MNRLTTIINAEASALNRRAVLNRVRDSGPVSRLELTSGLPFSATTVKRTVEELLNAGVLREVSAVKQHNRPGRRSSLLAVAPDYAESIGFVITPEKLEMVAVDLSGGLLARISFPDQAMTPPKIARKIGTEVAAWKNRRSASQSPRLLGIGIGVAGLVDASKGFVHFCPNLRGWESVEFGRMVRAETGPDVLVDDEVRCMALGETRHGRSRGEQTSLFVYVGRGVGAGIIIDGRLYRGRHGIAGEFGHITVKSEGPLCNCGNRGCLEAVASVDGIISATNELIAAHVFTTLGSGKDSRGPVTLEQLTAAVSAGDKVAIMVADDTGDQLGTGLADLINIFDPGLVVLGGEVVDAFGDFLIDRIAQTVRLRGIPAITGKTRIVRSQLEGAAAIGAATLPVERFFETDILNFF